MKSDFFGSNAGLVLNGTISGGKAAFTKGAILKTRGQVPPPSLSVRKGLGHS